MFPHRVERGVQHLQSLGFKVRIAPHALNQQGFVSDTPQNRVHDIHSMFVDSEVKAIVAVIGGDHSCHLLPLLDFDLIRKNPKIFMGFSDITVLNVAIWKKTGLMTFNGPALLTDFAEYPRMFEYTERYMLKALCEARPIGVVEPSTWWTEEFLDWAQKDDLKRPRARHKSAGWNWLRGGVAEGVLIGGCLGSLEHLRGTRFWPEWLVDTFILTKQPELYYRVREEVEAYKLDPRGHSLVALYSYALLRLIPGRDEKADDYVPGLLKKTKLKWTFAVGKTIQAIIARDQPAFDSSLDALLQAHRGMAKFGGLRETPEGLLCLPAMSLCKMALERGMALNAESEYLSKGYMDYIFVAQET